MTREFVTAGASTGPPHFFKWDRCWLKTSDMDELAKRRVAPTPSVPPKVKGTRPPNEIDFWRGYALIAIFINHIPGIFFENFTHRNFGFSDSAELFVFLAGWSLRAMVDRSPQLEPVRLVLRIGGRAVTLYIAQQVITVMAIAMIAATALITETTLVLQWNNAAAVFDEPVTANVGLVILSHHLGYFDILPLYIVLMSMAPLMAVLYRLSPSLMLAVSASLYVATLYTGFNLPTWPVEGRWFFNPFAWQFIFAIGYALGGDGPAQRMVSKYRFPLRIFGVLFVVFSVFAALLGWHPDWLTAPEPAAFFVVDKTFQTPLRLLHLLALTAALGGSFYFIVKYMRPIARFFSMLGRNSLNVFCVGSLLSLAGQIFRFSFPESLWVDTAILIIGLLLLSMTAWVSEWRQRLRA
ncbi:MAG: OpgC family protein [Beijerinckiaceae bacterium]